MHLKPEELIELLHGDTPVEKLSERLDHLDGCAQCAAAFEVLVALRAHRDEARTVVDEAREFEAAGPIPFPIQAPTAAPVWSGYFLKVAATVAVAVLTGLLVWSTPIRSLDGLLSDLAVDEFVEAPMVGPEDVRLAAGREALLRTAVRLLEDGDFAGAESLLLAQPAAALDDDLTRLYLGISQYFAGSHEEALTTLSPVTKSTDSTHARPAEWYQANSLLRLGRAGEALALLDGLASFSQELDQALFLDEARETASSVRELLGS